MSVRFVIGRSGSGKTFRCFSSIVKEMRARPLGPPIYWILPRQATFTAEREMTCASGLAGFCRARAVSFEQFGDDIFNDCGGAAIPEVTPLGRQMILGHLLRKLHPKLGYFSSVARQIGLAVELDRTFAELERAGKTADDLRAVVDELSQAGGLDVEALSLQTKLRDVQLLYDQYTQFLGQERLDQHRRLMQVLGSVRHCSFLSKSLVFVDGFAEFTDHERRMLAAVARAGATMEITLLMDRGSPLLRDPHLIPQEMGLFHRTEMTYRKLWFAMNEEGVEVGEPIVLDGTKRYAVEPLARLEKVFDGDTIDRRGQGNGQSGTPNRESEISNLRFEMSDSAKGDGRFAKSQAAIIRIEASDRLTEVDAVAREIRILLASGYRLRDIAVLVRDLEPYHGLIAASFDEHGIPYFVDRRRTAGHHPLLEFLRSAFRIALYRWPTEPVMALLKTGLAGVSLDEADELENYVLLHRIRAEAWESGKPWTFRRHLTRAREEESAPSSPEPARIDAIRRRVADKLLPFVQKLHDGPPLTVRQIASEVFDLLGRFDVRSILSQWMQDALSDPSPGAASRLEQRDEHEQVWAELVSLFDQMVDLLGEERVTPNEFLDVLESGLEQFDLALTPPTVDQVLVGQIDRTICPRVRAAFVLGLNEGEFPAASRMETVLSDRERRELGRRSLELDPDNQRRSLDERLLGYVALTRASERLILTRPVADDSGRKTVPSQFWRHVEEIVPEAVTTCLPPHREGTAEQISTPRQLVTALMRRVRNGDLFTTSTEAEHSAWLALYQWLAKDECCNDGVDQIRYRAWRALSYRNDASLSDEANRALFPEPLSVSVAQLESLAACPFQHFMRYGLRLEGRRDREVTIQDLGQLYHRILESLVGQAIRSNPDWADDPLPISDRMIHDAARQLGHTLRGELMLSTERNKYLLGRVERTLGQFVASQKEMMKRYRFRPTQVGLSFGKEGPIPALRLTTKAGAEVSVHGRIDRIDALPETDDVVALDYKLAAGPLSLPKVYHGLSLQLLTYLLVLQANGQELAGRPLTPAAAFYLQILRSLGEVDHPDDAVEPDDPRFLLSLKPRGIFDGRCMGDLDCEAEERSLVVNAYIKKDGGFGYRASSDVADSREFAGLLSLAKQRVVALADQLRSGAIEVRPYRLNLESPCPRCDFRSVCRFETFVNSYRPLPSISREQVLDGLKEGASHA